MCSLKVALKRDIYGTSILGVILKTSMKNTFITLTKFLDKRPVLINLDSINYIEDSGDCHDGIFKRAYTSIYITDRTRYDISVIESHEEILELLKKRHCVI